MMTSEEMKLTSNRNYQRMKELFRICYGLGFNIGSQTRLKELIKIINVILLISCCIDCYGQWHFIIRYIHNIPRAAECISTLCQTIISMIKMTYFLFTQRKFSQLIQIARTHEMLQKIEIFREDFPNSAQLKKEIEKVMENNWKNTRFQLLFFIGSCISITCNYFLYAMVVNFYNYIQGTPDYEPILTFEGIYPMWENKGMTFPYHPILMYIGSCADYISGMGAVSFDGIFIVLCVHGVSLVQVLKVLIQQSTSSTLPKEMRVQYLRYCINYYQRVFSYLEDIRQIYKHIMISQFILGLVILGIILFQASVGLEGNIITLIRMLMYISAAGYQVFIYCYNGQLLTNAMDEIPFALYSCEWYDESKEFKQLVQMMIMRTNLEYSFEISWFAKMSMPTFLALLKTSSSYFLLLRNLNE